MRNVLSNSLLVAGMACVVAGGSLGASANASFPGSNGRVLFDSARTGAINVFSVDPSNIASVFQTTSSADVDQKPFGSPDGTKVVFRSTRPDGNNAGEIWIANALNALVNVSDPDGATQLTFDNVDDTDPSFVTDSEVIYSHLSGGKYQLYTGNLPGPFAGAPLFSVNSGCDDTEAVANPVNPDQFAFTRTCSGSGSHVYFYDRSTPGVPPKDLTAANVASENGVLYAVNTDAEPDWHPTGSRISLTGRGDSSLAGGFSQIYSIKPDGTDRRPMWGYGNNSATWNTGKNDSNPAYSPDGTKLAFNRGTTTNGTDVFVDQASMNSPMSASAPAGTDITPSRGPDLHPSWLPVITPPNDVPETPLVVLLPLTGLLLGGFGLMIRRRSAAGV